MKRLLVIILSMLYMANAIGATVHLHYCMGRLVSADLSQNGDNECGRCGMKKQGKKHNCCRDEQKTIKATDHQLAAKTILGFSFQGLLPLQSYQAYSAPITEYSSVHGTSMPHAPPDVPDVPVYIAFQHFLV